MGILVKKAHKYLLYIYRFIATVKEKEESNNGATICYFTPYCWDRVDGIFYCRICRRRLEKVEKAFTDSKLREHVKRVNDILVERSIEAESMKRARIVWNYFLTRPSSKRFHAKMG